MVLSVVSFFFVVYFVSHLYRPPRGVTPTGARMLDYCDVAEKYASYIDHSWTLPSFHLLANLTKRRGTVCDIELIHFEPGTDLFRLAFLADGPCLKGHSERSGFAVVGFSEAGKVQTYVIGGGVEQGTELTWKALTGDGAIDSLPIVSR